MAPDTTQNLFYALYFLIAHNAVAIFYAICILVVTVLSVIKPTRGKIFLMWGFIILLLSFEFNKHILEPLRIQTMESLITERHSLRIEYYVNTLFIKILPTGLPIVGWSLVIIGVFFDKIHNALKKAVQNY